MLNAKPAAPKRDESFADEESFNSPDITPSSNQPEWGREVETFREKTVAATPAKDDDDVMSYFASLAAEDESDEQTYYSYHLLPLARQINF